MTYKVLGREYKEIWVTSDLHFGHKNVLKFCSPTRQFKDVDEMNEGIVKHWNENVGSGDLVIIVGDLSFLNVNETTLLLNRLSGTKGLVIGNHDRKLVDIPSFRKCFAFLHDIMSLTIEEQKYVFCHFPIYEWDSMQRGSMHLHGHCHGNMPKGAVGGRILDVGWDAQGRLIKLSEAKNYLLKKEIRSH